MRLTLAVSVLSLLIFAGCNGGSEANVLSTSEVQTPQTGGTQEDETSAGQIIAEFSGATFVSTSASQPGIVSFSTDTATWENAGLVEVASYTNTGDQPLVATFPDREVTFESDGSNLIWDSVSYRRAGGSALFYSQESMTQYFDGYTYDTVEDFDLGEGPTGELAMGKWSLKFNGDEVFWSVQDTVAVGTYTFVNGTRFELNLYNTDITVVLLDNDEFMVNSIVYKRDDSNQFDSQAKLVTFFDGATYESASLQVVSVPTADVGVLGYWSISFSNDTFTWSHQDVTEAGTVGYLGVNHFSAILSDREYAISVDGNSIFWDEKRYEKK